MSRGITYLAALLLLLCFGLEARTVADNVRLKNGDQITGEIIKADGKTLTIKTDYAGIISITADVVAQIFSSQTLWFTLDDGKTVVGKVTTKAGKYEVVKNEEEESVSLEPNRVKSIRSRSEQEQYDRLLRPSWLDLWDAGMNIGYSLTTGNIQSNTLSLGGNLERKTTRDKTTLYVTYLKSKNKTLGQTLTTANAFRGGTRYEVNLHDNLVAFGFADFEHNEIQLLDLRTVLGGGIGRYFIRNDRIQFQLFGGGSYNRDKFSADLSTIDPILLVPPTQGDVGASPILGVTRNSGEILVGEEFSTHLKNRVSFQERLQIFPNMVNRGEYRGTLDSSVITKLTKWLTWNIIVSDRYLSNPPFSSSNNDLLMTTGLGITLDRFNFKRW